MFFVSLYTDKRSWKFRTRKSCGSTRVPEAFLVPTNFNSCFLSSKGTLKIKCFPYIICDRIDQHSQSWLAIALCGFVGVCSPGGSESLMVDILAENWRNEKYEIIITTKKRIIIFKNLVSIYFWLFCPVFLIFLTILTVGAYNTGDFQYKSKSRYVVT